jgi:hypothetical protein
MDEIYQTLVCADYVNTLGKNMNTVNKIKEALLEASKEVWLNVNMEQTKYMVMSHHKTWQSFQGFRMTVTNQNSVHEKRAD